MLPTRVDFLNGDFNLDDAPCWWFEHISQPIVGTLMRWNRDDQQDNQRPKEGPLVSNHDLMLDSLEGLMLWCAGSVGQDGGRRRWHAVIRR